MNNYYEEILKKINLLSQENKVIEIIKILNYELGMPYIPPSYVEKFQNLLQKFQNIDEKFPEKNAYSDEELVKMLFEKDVLKQQVALVYLAKVNLRNFPQILKKRIESWKDTYKRSYLFELMSSQLIDIDIFLDNKKRNPRQDSVFKYKLVDEAQKHLESLTFQQPQILELSMSILTAYLLQIFPTKIRKSEPLAKDIFVVASSILKKNIKCTSRQKRIKELLERDGFFNL